MSCTAVDYQQLRSVYTGWQPMQPPQCGSERAWWQSTTVALAYLDLPVWCLEPETGPEAYAHFAPAKHMHAHLHAGHSSYHGALFFRWQGIAHASVRADCEFIDVNIITCVIWLKGMLVPRTLCTTSAATCTPAAGDVPRGGAAAAEDAEASISTSL
jgi:hypothetical protein